MIDEKEASKKDPKASLIMPRKSSRHEKLPEPTGPYTVGYLDYEWTPSGTKTVPEPPSKFMMARLFYPSSLDHAEAKKQRGLWIVSKQEGEGTISI